MDPFVDQLIVTIIVVLFTVLFGILSESRTVKFDKVNNSVTAEDRKFLFWIDVREYKMSHIIGI